MRRVAVPPALVPLPAAPSGGAGRVHVLHGETMGTYWSAKFVAPDGTPPARLHAEIEAVLARIVAQMSPWVPDSDLNRFSRAPPGTWCELPDDFFTVLDHAIALAQETDGAFDPALGRLVDLWGFGPTVRAGIPDSDSVAAARRRGAWRDILLDPVRRRAYQPGDAALDLCGAAKGHAVDLMARTCEDAGIRSYLVEIGGEFRGVGTKPDRQPWWVALERPAMAGHAPAEVIAALHGLAVATSGDYRRSFEAGGRRYAHTLDPETGYPLAAPAAAVTVFHHSCMKADALATALTVMGPETGLAFARERGLAVRFLMRATEGLSEEMSPAFAEMLAD